MSHHWVPPYTLDISIDAAGAALGPSAPSIVRDGTFHGLGFDGDSEIVHIDFEIPDEWCNDCNVELKVYWAAESGDAFESGEDVRWRAEYRALSWGTDVYDNAAAATISAEYRQSGAGADKATFQTDLVFAFDHADQPISRGDQISVLFNRDVTSETTSYSGEATVAKWEASMRCSNFPSHIG